MLETLSEAAFIETFLLSQRVRICLTQTDAQDPRLVTELVLEGAFERVQLDEVVVRSSNGFTVAVPIPFVPGCNECWIVPS